MVLLVRSPYRRTLNPSQKKITDRAGRAGEHRGMLPYADRFFNILPAGKATGADCPLPAQQAEIYKLDEPTNHLDVHYQWNLMELIKSLGATVLGVIHEMNLAAYYCDEFFVSRGRPGGCAGDSPAVLTSELLAGVFGVSAEVVQLQNGRPHIIIHGQIGSRITAACYKNQKRRIPMI
jgi:iron complex transport system ATP-binding protein